MRFPLILATATILVGLTACASTPSNTAALAHDDAARIAALGTGAPLASVDAALGSSKVIWSEQRDVAGTSYQVRLYDWVAREVKSPVRQVCNKAGCLPLHKTRYNNQAYAVVIGGDAPTLRAYGTLNELNNNADPAIAQLVPGLKAQYAAYRSAN